MKPENQSRNVFIKTMSKFFIELSHHTPRCTKKANPRMTWIRLRKIREARRNLESEIELSLDDVLTRTGEAVVETQIIEPSLADEVEDNQSEQPQLDLRDNQSITETKDRKTMKPNRTMQEFCRLPSSALQEIAKNPLTPMVVLKWLAGHYDVKVRRALASNQAIDNDILHVLVGDAEESVKKRC